MNVLDFRGMRPELMWFANEMERKLEMNEHKRHWTCLTEKAALQRLSQETEELRKAIANGEPACIIVSEAADVANFAMFIADNVKQREEQEPSVLVRRNR